MTAPKDRKAIDKAGSRIPRTSEDQRYSASAGEYIGELNRALDRPSVDVNLIGGVLVELEKVAKASGHLFSGKVKELLAKWFGRASEYVNNNNDFSAAWEGGLKKKALSIGDILGYNLMQPRGLDEDFLPEEYTKEDIVADLKKVLRGAHQTLPHIVPFVTQALAAASGEVVARVPPAPPRWDEATLEEFRAYAKANPWPGDRSLSPSQFILQRYAKWLGSRTENGEWVGPSLWRSDLEQCQPKLATAYSQEIRRHPENLVIGLFVRPTQHPPGTPRLSSRKLVSELSESEREEKRRRDRIYKERYKNRLSGRKLP